MNVPVVVQPKPMLLAILADKYSLREEEFSKTVRATCGLATASAEQFAAFLIVAKQYDLNPLTKEIYAFPGKGGGVVPIVSIDGWVNLVNSHPQCDGFDFAVANDGNGDLYSITCTMHRKDRKHPTVVTEYLSECIRQTEPWKMKHRMLRHKSFIQAARYAFGFAGIYDEDEGRTIAEAVDVTPKAPLRVPSPSEVESPATIDEAIEMRMDEARANRGGEVKLAGEIDPISSGPQPTNSGPDINKDYDGWFSYHLDKIAHADDGGYLESYFNNEIQPHEKGVFPSDWHELQDAFTRQHAKLNADE